MQQAVEYGHERLIARHQAADPGSVQRPLLFAETVGSNDVPGGGMVV